MAAGNRLIFFIVLFFIAFGQHSHAQLSNDSLFKLAQLRFNGGDYAEALKYNIKALEKIQKENNCVLEAYATHQVGKTHYYLHDRRLALSWIFKARKLALDCGADSIVQKTLHNIGSIYQELNMPDSSLFFYEQAKKLLDKTQNWAELSTLYGVMGELCHRQLKKDELGRSYIELCEKYALLSKDTNKIAFSLVKQGIFLSRHGDCRKGLTYFKNARKLYRHIKQVEGEMYAMNCIGLAMSLCGDTATYRIYGGMQRMRDSIFQSSTAEKVAHYKTLYETEKTKAENTELTESNRQKTILLVSILTVSILVLLMIWFAYTRYRAKKENELEKQKSQHKTLRYKAVVEAEEKERTRIARELHDGIGQILSAAKMNVSVINPADTNGESALQTSMNLIDKAVKEVRTISHNLMPASLVEMGLSEALKEMAYGVNAARTFKLELILLDELQLPPLSEVTIFRVIQEIVNNGIKHSGATVINLSVGNKNGYFFAEISDNGIGFDTQNITKSSGIGWKNIYSRVELLNGTIHVTSSEGSGTEVRIEFKIQD